MERSEVRWALCLLACVVGAATPTSPPRFAHAQDLIRGNVRPLAETSLQLVVDSRQPLGQLSDSLRGPFYRISGWAADVQATSGTGVQQLVVFLDGPSDRGRLLGWARYGLPRPDVATALNNPGASASGFELVWPVADMPLQIEPVRQSTLYIYADTEQGWVLARVPVALAMWADGGQAP
jgi:hypothetical protein